MKLIAHRGLWKDRSVTNTFGAFESAFRNGLGIETDLRSFSGKLYLSHDPIETPERNMRFEDLLDLSSKYSRLPLFLNIKEDGLLDFLTPFLNRIEKMPIIFFDMSVPELIRYAKVFPSSHLCTRLSEFEPVPAAIELCDWIWVDGFYRDIGLENLRNLSQTYQKNWAFVSPELHGRGVQPFWSKLEEAHWLPQDRTFLCTDLAEEFGLEKK